MGAGVASRTSPAGVGVRGNVAVAVESEPQLVAERMTDSAKHAITTRPMAAREIPAISMH